MQAYFIITFSILFQVISSSELETMDAKALASAISTFSAKFCNELDKTSNVISSPLSVGCLLSMLALGATEPAHEEILLTLGIPNNDAIRSSMTSISEKFKATKGVTLKVANKIYLREGGSDLNPALKEDAVKVFNSAFESLNFAKKVEAAAIINKWVEDQTNNRIKDLLSSDALDDMTRIVLVNAIYFKGNWKDKFDPNNTIDRPFHVNADTTVDIPMMNKMASYRYGESKDLKAKLLEIPYEGDEASMLFVLPDEITGLDELVNKLAGGFDLVAETQKMFTGKVQVTIPKFKIETTIDVKPVLQKIGVKAIFNSENSGLNNLLVQPEPLYVSTAIQKAFIEVNEEGAEAAAATGAAIRKKRALPPVEEFLADRPFLYCVMTEEPVFVGIYRGSGVATTHRHEDL